MAFMTLPYMALMTLPYMAFVTLPYMALMTLPQMLSIITDDMSDHMILTKWLLVLRNISL